MRDSGEYYADNECPNLLIGRWTIGNGAAAYFSSFLLLFSS